MARKRMISPNIWEDPSFNKLSFGARLMFIGMISNADDEGYIRGDRGSLKRLIFGFDDQVKDLDSWIKEIITLKNLHFYEVEGEEYAHFLKWHEHQKQQKDRIQESSYPPCSKCLATANQVLTEVKLSKDKLREDNLPAVGEDAAYGDVTISQDEDLKPIAKLKREQAIENGYKGHLTLPILRWSEEKVGKFPNPKKQLKAIATMLNTGRGEQELKDEWELLEGDDYWAEKGFDWGVVLNQIGKKKGSRAIPTLE